MILSDERILEEMDKGTIKITLYDRESLGSNSYDVHLGKWLATYVDEVLDARQHNRIEYFEIPEEGFVLQPQHFYLGQQMNIPKPIHTFRSWRVSHVPVGWASTSMLPREKGMSAFVATGLWTFGKHPVRIYKGMPIGQLIYFPVHGEVQVKV